MSAPSNSRRGLLAGLAALPIAASAAPGAADAELVALCADYIAAVEAYNTNGSDLECEDDPDWHHICDLQDRIEAMPVHGIAGLCAMARLAASQAIQPDGSEQWSDSYTGSWPELVCRGLLRLYGGREA